MAEEIKEAKDFDQLADEVFDKEEKETPADTSTEIKPEGEETKATEISTAEVDKTEQVKEVEADTSLSVEDKIAKIKEILGNDEKAIDAYIKEKGYHKDPAWQKQREIIDRLKKEGEAKVAMSEEDRTALDEFKKFRSSPDYIITSMKSQGYTQEAIDKKLRESGFEVPTKPQDDVQLVLKKLNIDVSKLAPEDKANITANIEDVSKIADIIFADRLSKILPKELAPLQDHLGLMEKSDNASKLITVIKDTVKTEGILDFDKDVEPVLNKFLDENPDASQQDVLEHFKSINHQLTIERLKIGNKKGERDNLKSNLRQNIPITKTAEGLPQKTGNFDKDADAFFDTVNYKE